MGDGRRAGGEIIRFLRQQKKMTLKMLAKKAGIHYVFISRMERGMEKPSEKLIRRLGEILEYRGNMDVLVASFGRVPDSLTRFILNNPEVVAELPALLEERAQKSKTEPRESA